jgi:hypothetical protein
VIQSHEKKKKKRQDRNAVCKKNAFFINIVFIRFSGRGIIGWVCHQKVTSE